jgi:hypothetical protein
MNDHQGNLFGERPTGREIYFSDKPSPRDPSVSESEKPRLANQNAAVLARLKAGPATNRELAMLALKYTSRISDLRAAGHVIRPIKKNRVTGETTYQLGE